MGVGLKIRSLFLLLLLGFLPACLGDGADSVDTRGVTVPQITQEKLDDDGVGSPTPDPVDPDGTWGRIIGALVSAYAPNDDSGQALVLGRPGATSQEEGVDKICALNQQTGISVCGPNNAEGAFQLYIAASVGHLITVWAKGPELPDSGPDMGITVRVQSWSRRFPSRINALAFAQIKVSDNQIEPMLAVGSDDGLYLMHEEDLTKDPSKVFPIRITQGLPSMYITSLAYTHGSLWIGTLGGLVQLDDLSKPIIVHNSDWIDDLAVNSLGNLLAAGLNIVTYVSFSANQPDFHTYSHLNVEGLLSHMTLTASGDADSFWLVGGQLEDPSNEHSNDIRVLGHISFDESASPTVETYTLESLGHAGEPNIWDLISDGAGGVRFTDWNHGVGYLTVPESGLPQLTFETNIPDPTSWALAMDDQDLWVGRIKRFESASQSRR